MTNCRGRSRSYTFAKTISFGLVVLSVSFAIAQNEKPARASRDRRPSDYTELTKAPEKARTRSNPLETDPDAVAVGRRLFDGHCSECHGDDAQGTKKAPSLRVDEIQQASPGTLFWVLTNGVARRGMPVWSKLPEPQRWQIVSYIKSLGSTEKSE